MKFEGEYLYGKKIKGKFYIKGRLEFDGKFLYDRKWNGKGYDEHGNIIYELNNGDGKVKEYKFGNFEFEGEYLKGKKHGMDMLKNMILLIIFWNLKVNIKMEKDKNIVILKNNIETSEETITEI